MDKNNERIKNFISDDLTKSLNSFLNDSEYDCKKYDDDYTGVVVNNNDSDKEGKCQIRVFGVHSDNIQDVDLPWAFPDFGFRGGLKGSFIVPPVGCMVNVYFERGELYIPRYNNKVINVDKLPTNKDKNYPDNMVFYESDNGDSFEIDRKAKETTLKHSSGTMYFMDSDKTHITHNTKSKIEFDKTKMVFEHIKGAKIVINETSIEISDNNGNKMVWGPKGIEVNSKTILELIHGVMLKSNAKAVVPSGQGPFCALPTCVITGVPHCGQIAI